MNSVGGRAIPRCRPLRRVTRHPRSGGHERAARPWRSTRRSPIWCTLYKHSRTLRRWGEEDRMAHPGAYRGTKRQKELKRLQKQEEKRQKRILKKGEEPNPDEGVPEF